MIKFQISEAEVISDYQIHAHTNNGVYLLDLTCSIDGIYFNSAQEMADYINNGE